MTNVGRILELTGGKPRLHGGTMLYDDLSKGAQHADGAHLHGVRDREIREGPPVRDLISC